MVAPHILVSTPSYPLPWRWTDADQAERGVAVERVNEIVPLPRKGTKLSRRPREAEAERRKEAGAELVLAPGLRNKFRLKSLPRNLHVEILLR